MTVTEFLRRHGARISEDELVSLLDDALGEHLVTADSAALTAAAESVLTSIGARRATPAAVARASAARAADLTAMGMASLDVDAAAVQLGVDPSRVRHRIAERALYALRVGRRRLLPSWQFAEGRPLPGLARLLAALPPDLHPLEVEGFVTTPRPELEIAGRMVSPREWLHAGGDPEPIVALANALRVPA